MIVLESRRQHDRPVGTLWDLSDFSAWPKTARCRSFRHRAHPALWTAVRGVLFSRTAAPCTPEAPW